MDTDPDHPVRPPLTEPDHQGLTATAAITFRGWSPNAVPTTVRFLAVVIEKRMKVRWGFAKRGDRAPMVTAVAVNGPPSCPAG